MFFAITTMLLCIIILLSVILALTSVATGKIIKAHEKGYQGIIEKLEEGRKNHDGLHI